MLAINGKQASFLAGGEFPYPILQGGQGGIGTVTVAFREFGVRIDFLPVVTPRGTIRLDVAPEVSALDYHLRPDGSGIHRPWSGHTKGARPKSSWKPGRASRLAVCWTVD